MPKLTKSYIDKLPLPPPRASGQQGQAIYRDDSLQGFGILVSGGGTKAYIVERRINNKVKRITIGRHGLITPTQARNKAIEILGELAIGNDPNEAKRAERVKGVTLIEAFNDYLDARKTLKPSTIGNYTKLMNGCFKDWHSRPLVEISKDDVAKRHTEIGKRSPTRANGSMRVLRAVFNYAKDKYETTNGDSLIIHNPVDRLSKGRSWYPDKRRRTLLERHELAPWFAATQNLDHEVSRDYLQFLLFTGLRKMEAATLQWKDVDMIDHTFTIQDTKNGEPHTLPLPSYLIEMLTAREQASESHWVFPSPLNDGHLREPRGAVKHLGTILGKPFIIHDLRRTFITIAESLDIPAYALKRLMNHRDKSDVTAGYIVSNVERLREPMQRICDFILDNINRENEL